MMNILFFSEPSYPRHPGGAGKCAHLLAAGLAARGHTIHLVCETDGRLLKEKIDGVHVHRVQISGHRSTQKQLPAHNKVRRLLAYLEREIDLDSVDLIHDVGGFLSYFAPIEFHLHKIYGISLVLHFQFLSAGREKACTPKYKRRLSRAALSMECGLQEKTPCFPVRIADLIICPSNQEAALVRRLYRPQPGRLTVIPNPVRFDSDSPELDRSWRGKLVKPDQKLVLFGGRMDIAMKGADIVRRAFGKILEVYPQARLLLLTADRRDSAFFQRLGSAVKWIGWVNDIQSYEKIVSAVDVVIVPSRYEPFGMMCSEAMAMGIPVIASPVGGLREMIIHGKNGYLLRGRSPKTWANDLAQHILLILSNPAMSRKLGQNAKEFATQHLKVEIVAERIERLYESLLDCKGNQLPHGVTPPFLVRKDQDRYLDTVDKLAGCEARKAAEKLVHYWCDSIEDRCLSCGRDKIAHTTLDLLSLAQLDMEAKDGKLKRKYVNQVQAVVEATCPLSLLQTDYITTSELASRNKPVETD